MGSVLDKRKIASGSTVTGHGWSYYEALLRCPQEAAFLLEAWADPNSGKKRGGTGAGTGYHRLQERYHRNAKPFATTAVDLSDLAEAAQKKAIDAFGAYRARFPRNAWGRIVRVEKEYSGTIDGIPVSIRPDLETRIEARSVPRIMEVTGALGLTSGYWIIDWKRYAEFDQRSLHAIVFGMRPIWYRCVWNAIVGAKMKKKTRIKGMITHVYDASRKAFKPIIHGPVTSHEEARFRSVLDAIEDRQFWAPDPRARPFEDDRREPSMCVTWGHSCDFFRDPCHGVRKGI